MYSTQSTISIDSFDNLNNTFINKIDLLNQYILQNYTNITLPNTLTQQWIQQNLPNTPITYEIINIAKRIQIQKYNSVINYGWIFFILCIIYILINSLYINEDFIIENHTYTLENKKYNDDFLFIIWCFSTFIPIILLLFFQLCITDIDSCSLYLWLALICSTYSICIRVLLLTTNISFIMDESYQILTIYAFVFLLGYYSYNTNNLLFLLLILIFIFYSSNIFKNYIPVYIFCKIIGIFLNLFIFIFSIYLLSTFDFNIRIVKNFNVFGFSSFLLLLMIFLLYTIDDNDSYYLVFQKAFGIYSIGILSFIFFIIAIYTSYTDISILNYPFLVIFCLIIFVFIIITLCFSCNITKSTILPIFLFILVFLMINKYIMYTLLAMTPFFFFFFFVENDHTRFIILFLFSLLFFIKTTIDIFVNY